jgi:hypothetical protein
MTANPNHPAFVRLFQRLLWFLLAYFGLSALTFRFMDVWWLGELPILAVIQLPKAWIFQELMKLLMKLVAWAGLSTLSYSPDYLMLRAYAFALVYVLVLTLVLGIGLFMPKPFRAGCRRWFAAVCVVAAIDFLVCLLTILNQKGGVSVY